MEEEVTINENQRYRGDMKEGHPHGFGKLTWANGDVYEGQFHFGKRHGKGKRINAD